MTYLEFLGRWYNLVFLGVAATGLLVGTAGKLLGRDLFLAAAVLVGIAVAGLTLNGAVHDLSLGRPGQYFAVVLASSAVAGSAAGWAVNRLRRKLFPPVSGLRWNPVDQAGERARIVTSDVTAEPGSGRAQREDDRGRLVLVRCHTAGGSIGFGKEVRLEAYDAEEESYRVVTE